MSNRACVAFAAGGWILLPRGGEASGEPGWRLLWSAPRKSRRQHSELTVPTRPAFLFLLGTHLSPTVTPVLLVSFFEILQVASVLGPPPQKQSLAPGL